MPKPWEAAQAKQTPWAAAQKGDVSSGDQKYTPAESAGYGAAQGATFGFAPAIVGGAKAAYGSLSGDEANFMDAYRKNRDEFRQKLEEAQKQNPGSYFGGQVAGSIPTMFVPGLNVAKAGSFAGSLGRAGLAGGLIGLGESRADLTKGDVKEAAKDVAKGATIGAVTQGALSGGKAVLQNTAAAPKKILSTMMGLPEEGVDRYIANPQKVMNAPDLKTVTTNVMSTVNDLKNDIIGGSQASREILSKEGQKFSGREIADQFQKKIDSIISRSEGVIEPEDEALIKYLSSLRDQYATVPAVSANRLKDSLQKIDRVTEWETAPGQFVKIDDAAKKEVRRGLDDLLKTSSVDYKNQMSQVSKDAGLLEDVSQKFSTPEKTSNLLNKIRRGKSPFAEEDLAKLDQRFGTSFTEDLKDALAKEAFDKQVTNGSRNVNLYKEAGRDIGEKTGLPFMGTLGAITGGTVDKYGPKIGKGIIDTGLDIQAGLQKIPGSQSVYDAATGLGGIMSNMPLNVPATEYFIEQNQTPRVKAPWELMGSKP